MLSHASTLLFVAFDRVLKVLESVGRFRRQLKDVESFVAFEWLWRYFNHIDSIMQRCFEEQTLHTLCCLYYCTLSAYLRRKSGIGMGFTVGLRGCLTPNVWTHGKRLAVGDLSLPDARPVR